MVKVNVICDILTFILICLVASVSIVEFIVEFMNAIMKITMNQTNNGTSDLYRSDNFHFSHFLDQTNFGKNNFDKI